MMMPGSSSAQKPCTKMRTISLVGTRGGGMMVSLRTCHHQAIARPMAMRMPGTMPARNSLVIDRPPATPKMTKPIDGGITGPMMPAAAIRPADWSLRWPACTIIGTSSADSAAASATAEPDSADRIHAARSAT